ncbi:DUF955 domain-containing protein [Halobacteriales archaeon Cl-PHB]
MASDSTRVAFDAKDTRDDEMHRTVDQWLAELTNLTDEARASDEFQEWLDVQSRFHDYSYRNTLLITQQCPEATKVAGYRTWQREFDRHVTEGESAIWIWAPIVTQRCPECHNSESYHTQSDCDYDETPPDEWERGLVGFRPAPVFDVSQTKGESLSELDTAAAGDAGQLVPALLQAADDLGIDARVIPEADWDGGEAMGHCKPQPNVGRPLVEVRDRETEAAIAGVLVHEHAHALLHVGDADDTERAKREVEAEAVAYVVGRHFGLDTSNSAFYLASWADEDSDALEERLGRISRTAEAVIEATAAELPALEAADGPA